MVSVIMQKGKGGRTCSDDFMEQEEKSRAFKAIGNSKPAIKQLISGFFYLMDYYVIIVNI
jgi:hypothetical protein